MALPVILKRASTWIVLGLVVGGGIWYWRSSAASNASVYETAIIERRDVVQTVEITGSIKPASRIDLAFKMSGTIGEIYAKKGDVVERGDVLAELKNEDVTFAMRSARAALAIAQANLASRVAGETAQAIRVAETSVEQARVAYDKAVSDLESAKLTTANTVRTAQVAVETAKNSLANADAIANQNVQNSYDSVRASLNAALGPMTTALTDGDAVTGVDNSGNSGIYANAFGVLAYGSMERAQNSYRPAKLAKQEAETAVRALTAQSTSQDILSAAEKLRSAIVVMQTYLTDVQTVLSASLVTATFTSTQLSTYQASIATDRTSISTQNSTVLAAIQTIKGTELTRTQTVQSLEDAYTTAKIALGTAETNASVSIKTAEAAVATTKASLSAAEATLDLKKAGPRGVDLAPLRAAVEQAQVAYEKAEHDMQNAWIVAPVNGTIADIIPSAGEQVTANVAVVKMVGAETYSIEALTPEVDVAKMLVGQSASITLDAYGDDVKFQGTVTAKDPDQTKVQDAVYYKTYVQIEPGEREVKPGMTANVTVTTGEKKQTLSMPLRAIRTKNGDKFVRVLVNEKPSERLVVIGLKGDEGRVEVLSGVKEGEKVIVAETTKK